MTRDEMNALCRAMPSATHVVQWGGADVWKVGGKVFAVIGWSDGETAAITFKTSALSFEILQEQPGLRPAPYLASRGFTWIQHYAPPGLPDADLAAYVAESHRLVAEGLSAKKRRALGLTLDARPT